MCLVTHRGEEPLPPNTILIFDIWHPDSYFMKTLSVQSMKVMRLIASRSAIKLGKNMHSLNFNDAYVFLDEHYESPNHCFIRLPK